MDVRAIAQEFYASLADRNDTWQQHLSDDVVFSDASGLLHARGRDAFVQSFTRFLTSVERVRLRQLIVEGGQACAVVEYVYVNRARETLSQTDAEVWTAMNGHATSLTIYFDITAYRAFMAR